MSRVLPILFNTEMVRAVLDGRKTATRRVLKPQPAEHITCEDGAPYQPEDILYVRETWTFLPCVECTREGTDCGRTCVTYEDRDSISEGCFVYRADHPHPEHVSWSPSIHMPKEAARIWLKVKAVRVERLQEIDGQEVLKEGVNSHVHPKANYFDMNQREMFENLWNSTVKKSDFDRYGWDADPFVWVIEFERCGKPEGGRPFWSAL